MSGSSGKPVFDNFLHLVQHRVLSILLEEIVELLQIAVDFYKRATHPITMSSSGIA